MPLPEIYILLAAGVIVGLLLLQLLLKGIFGKRRQRVARYRPTTHLFTAAERSFYGVLVGAVGPDYKVFGKVRLADIILPEGAESSSAWWSAFNRVAYKHIDFVICEQATSKIHCCVELDDSSHARRDRKERDEFLEEMLSQSGVPLLRVPAQRGYTPSRIREAFLEATS